MEAAGWKPRGRNPAKDAVRDFYHGTYAACTARILEEGLNPGLGAGSDQLKEHYGMFIPCVYVADSWKTASHYPMGLTTRPVEIADQKKKSDIGGGSYMSLDGTAPLRVVSA